MLSTNGIAKGLLLAGCAVVAIALPGVASAQNTPSAKADQDIATNGDVIVTARKRAEDIQTVPISITALTAADLQQRSISNLTDLANATPGFAYTTANGGGTATIILRGIAPAITQNDLNVDANVGTFIDGIYQTSRNTLDIISILDVGQIEIAKGPQSALYGRSTFAGAVGISTSRPSHKLEAAVTGTVAENKDYRLRGTISGPIIDGLLYARVAAGYLTYDGYAKNAAAPNDNLNGYKKYGVTGSIEFTPTPEFTALLSGYITKSKNEPTATSLLPISAFNCGVPSASFGGPLVYCGEAKAPRVADITPDIPDGVVKTRQIALNMKYEAGFADFTSVTGFNGSSGIYYGDYDGTSAGLLYGVCTITATNTCTGTATYTRTVRANLLLANVDKVRAFSQEFRIQSKDSSAFHWLLGGNYYFSNAPINNTVAAGADGAGLGPNDRFIQILPVQAVPNTGAPDATGNLYRVATSASATQVLTSFAMARTRSKSVFGALGYDLGKVRVSAEARYSWDTKYAQTLSATAPYPIFGGTADPDPSQFPVAGLAYRTTFRQFTPRFTVDYRAFPDFLVYANAAKGARDGGFNTVAVNNVNGILQSEVAYNSETNWTYEVGIKSRLFDRRLLLNASAFHTDWKNVQISAFTTNPNLPINAVVPNITRNAGNVKSNGFEVQSEFKVNSLINIGGSVTYANPKFQAGAYDASNLARCRLGTTPATYTAAPGCPPIIAVATANGGTQYVTSLEGLRPLRSVKLQWNAHASVGTDINSTWKALGRVDVNYTGPVYGTNLNTYYFGERTLTNLRFSLDSQKLSVALFATNVFDKLYTQNSIAQPRADQAPGNNIPELFVGQGRQIGLTATLRY